MNFIFFIFDKMIPLDSEEIDNNFKSLKSNLAARYGKEHVLITTSGMNAISAVIYPFSRYASKFNIICGNECYVETIPMITKFLEKWDDCCEESNFHEFFVGSDKIIELFETKLKNQNNILFIESCSNPSGYIFDFTKIEKLRELSKKLIVIIDNTWLTDVIFNPFDYGADIVVSSLGRYYSDGTALGGCAIFNDKNRFERSSNMMKDFGIRISPYNVAVINEKLKTVDIRVTKTSIKTLQIIEELNDYFSNESIPVLIDHPSCQDHPMVDLAKKFFKNSIYPSVFVFSMEINKEENINEIVREFCKENNIHYERFYGSDHSSIEPFIPKIGSRYYFRFAVGYKSVISVVVEEIKKLINKLI